MNCAKICILTQISQESFSSFLNGKKRLTLEANLGACWAGYLSHDTLKRVFGQHQIGTILILSDLFENDCAWSCSHTFLGFLVLWGLRQHLSDNSTRSLRELSCLRTSSSSYLWRGQGLTKVGLHSCVLLVGHDLRTLRHDSHLLLLLSSSL